jgi:DNA-binding response OmpR family regulator
MSQTILVAEDDPKTAASVRLYLENAGYQVQVVHTGSEALAQARQARPDLVVLDIMLPHISGIDVCQLLRNESQVPIIMLTARTLESDRIQGFESGADDYVTKPFSPRELVVRVRALLRRASQPPIVPLRLRRFGELMIDLARHTVEVDGESVSLTAKEFKLLDVLSQSPGYVFTRDMLVERAFGPDYEGLARTVDAHVMNLRRKLEPDAKKPIYILTVYGVGYKFADDVA